jgi:hypothetical protein
MIRSSCNIAILVVALFLATALALAQITVGTVTGRVVDPSGAVVAGARVDLIGETAAVITNATGDYVIPNLAPDTSYTLEVSAPSFKILRRTGVVITGVQNGGNPAGGTRLGGQSQNNIMMDGIRPWTLAITARCRA